MRGGFVHAVVADVGPGLGDAEVEDLHLAVGRDEQVVRLQIAVHDTAVVRGGEAARNLGAIVRNLIDPERPATETGCSVSPDRSSHTKYGTPSAVPMSCTDRMFGWLSAAAARASCSNRRRRSGSVQNSRGSSFTATSRRSSRIAGTKHFAHTTSTERSQDAVRAQRLRWRQGHRSMTVLSTVV